MCRREGAKLFLKGARCDSPKCAVERRENQLEDQSVFDRVKLGTTSASEAFDYYLGWLADPSITKHFELIPTADVTYAREWGMKVAVEDLRRVVDDARKRATHVVLERTPRP